VEEGVRPRRPPAEQPGPASSTVPKEQGHPPPVDVGPPRAGPHALPAMTREQVAHRGRRKGIEGIAPPGPAFSTVPKGQGPRLPVDVGPPRAGPRARPATTTEQVAHRGRRKAIEGIAPPAPAFLTVPKGQGPRLPVDVGPLRAGPRALPAMARAQVAHRARRAEMDRPGRRARLARMTPGRRSPGDGESVPARRRRGGRKRIPDPLRSLLAR
jgi:hypothetical protein